MTTRDDLAFLPQRSKPKRRTVRVGAGDYYRCLVACSRCGQEALIAGEVGYVASGGLCERCGVRLPEFAVLTQRAARTLRIGLAEGNAWGDVMEAAAAVRSRRPAHVEGAGYAVVITCPDCGDLLVVDATLDDANLSLAEHGRAAFRVVRSSEVVALEHLAHTLRGQKRARALSTTPAPSVGHGPAPLRVVPD